MRFAVRIVVLAGALSFFAPALAAAQVEEPFEVYGGFSWIRVGTDGGDLIGDVNALGFQGEFAFYITDWFAIAGEVGYNRDTIDIPAIPIGPRDRLVVLRDIDVSATTFLFGPRFKFAAGSRIVPSVRALFGAVRAKLNTSIPILDDLDINASETGFGTALGGAVDVQISDTVWYRIAQPDVLITVFDGESEADFRLSTGVVFRF